MAVLAALLPAARAHAYDDQLSLDVGAGYALLATPRANLVRQGPAAELGVGYGVSDAIVLRANLGYAAVYGPTPVSNARRHEQLGRIRVEALYQLDVVQWVPFFGLGITATTSPPDAAGPPLRAGGHIVLGIDYLYSRSWVLGLDARTALLAQGSLLVNATDVTLRVSRMFEAF